MTSPDNGAGRVTYTVKELIEKVDHKLDVIVEQIATKAGVDELARLVVHIEKLDARIDKLEDDSASTALLEEYRTRQERQRKSDRRWMIGMAVTTLLGVIGLVASVVANAFPG
jgi:hypothetical protein